MHCWGVEVATKNLQGKNCRGDDKMIYDMSRSHWGLNMHGTFVRSGLSCIRLAFKLMHETFVQPIQKPKWKQMPPRLLTSLISPTPHALPFFFFPLVRMPGPALQCSLSSVAVGTPNSVSLVPYAITSITLHLLDVTLYYGQYTKAT